MTGRSSGWLGRRWHVVRRFARILSRPVRRAARGRGGVAVQTCRGYGSCREIFMIGRVLRQPGGPPSGNAVADLGRLILRRGVRDAALTVCFDGQEERVPTDRDGYFRLHLRLRRTPPPTRILHPVALELHAPETTVTGRASGGG